MPQVKSLKKKKEIDTSSKVELENEPGSLYLKFEEQYPSLSKFIENDHSLLLRSKSGLEDTIVKEILEKQANANAKNENETTRKKENKGNEEKAEVNNYSNVIADEDHYDRIDSGSFKRNVDDKPCYACRNNQCFIQ